MIKLDFDVNFGVPEKDWRLFDDPDADDEELDQTPPDVIGLLGFDPREEAKNIE